MLSRIGVGVVSLFVLAHGLGASDYGFVATVVATSTIGALLTDFGFSTQAMRDIAEAPDRAGQIMTDCLRIKGVLTVAATLICLVMLLTMRLSPALFWSSIMLFASVMVLSFGDLAVVSLRGIGRYEEEAIAVLAGAVLFAVVVATTALLAPGLWQLSLALLVSRLGQTCIAFLAVARKAPLGRGSHASLSEAWRFVRSSSPLALDTILTVLAQQVDVIFVSAILGLTASAAYQVASRLAMYFLLPAQVLAGSYIPRLAAERASGGADRLERRMQREFGFVGVALGAAFLLAPLIAGRLLPKGFEIPLSFSIALSAFIALRYMAAAFGVVLMVRRRTDQRLIGQAVGFVAMLITMPIGLKTIGVEAAPWSIAFASACAMAMYLFYWAKINRSAGQA